MDCVEIGHRPGPGEPWDYLTGKTKQNPAIVPGFVLSGHHKFMTLPRCHKFMLICAIRALPKPCRAPRSPAPSGSLADAVLAPPAPSGSLADAVLGPPCAFREPCRRRPRPPCAFREPCRRRPRPPCAFREPCRRRPRPPCAFREPCRRRPRPPCAFREPCRRRPRPPCAFPGALPTPS